MENIRKVVNDFIHKKRSGVVYVRRGIFGDPLLTVYIYRGKLLFALSFLVKKPWWQGLLPEDLTSSLQGMELYRYAAEKYGEKYLNHLIKYSEEVLRTTITEIKKNGWEVHVEVADMDEEAIEEMFGIDIVRRKVLSSRADVEETKTRSIVLSLISGKKDAKKEKKTKKRKKIDPTLHARAMGFSIIYVPGEKDRHGFFRALKSFGEPMKGEFEKVRLAFVGIKGNLAIVFPLFILVRLWIEDREVWAITVDVRIVTHTLRFTEVPENLPEDRMEEMAERYNVNFAWKRDDRTLNVLGPGFRKVMEWEEFVKYYTSRIKEFRELVQKAVEEFPGNYPPVMKRMEIGRLLRMSRNPEGFKKLVLERYGINL